MPRKTNESSKTSRVKKNSGSKFHIEFLSTAQRTAWASFQQHDVLFLVGPAGVGKALTMDSKIYTPKGFVLMKDINLGDEVCSFDGNTSKVVGVFPQGKRKIYKVTFKDGSSVECCENHLWKVGHIQNGWDGKVVDTKWLIDNYESKHGRKVIYIDCCKPAMHSRKEFSILPYTMGILISEGNLSNSNVCFSSADEKVLSGVKAELAEGYVVKKNGNYDCRLVKEKRSNAPNFYKEELKSLNLWGCKSHEKFIPEQYLYGSVDQRISLLKGLMDGDGTVEASGGCSYSTSSERLVKDYKLLINSLGGTCKVRTKNSSYKKDGRIIKGRISYTCTPCLPNEVEIFSLDRKKDRRVLRSKHSPRRYFEKIEYLGEKECQCIMVDSKDHLFLTNEYIVTHNTHLAMAFAINEVLNGNKDRIILTRPIVESGESLGYLPGDFHEKVNPYMLPLYDCMHKLVGKEGPQSDKIRASAEVAPLAYMRGRTFDDAVCIFDEAQNATKDQLRLFMSRFGENSKIIITGDPMQSDIGRDVALTDVVRKLESLSGVGIIEFKNSSIVRHPLVGSILERLN